jgi:D-arabinan endo alpha-(1,5)-arabinofuranosidase
MTASAEPVLREIHDVARVAQLTGRDSINHTDTAWDVHGTDLGHLFSMGDRLYMVFGDTYGRGFSAPPDGASARFNWRSNTMAVIADRKPADGLTFESMITDARGQAKELLPSLHDITGMSELTVIPTYGIAVGRRMILHYMSVRQWGDPGRWSVNHSGLACSDDRGKTWTRPPDARWGAGSGFAQVAIVRKGSHCYFLGIPAGRFGAVRLARVPAAEVLDLQAYRYLHGVREGRPQWGREEAPAAVLVPAPVGELSVMWNPFLGRWIMTHLDEQAHAVVLREAPELWGPWSASRVLVHADSYPQLYGAYLHPWLVENRGEVIYFTLSQWVPYNVLLMRARLASK